MLPPFMSHFCLPHLEVVKASGTIDELALPLLKWGASRLYNAISSNKAHDQQRLLFLPCGTRSC
jgi:hypothetical protein